MPDFELVPIDVPGGIDPEEHLFGGGAGRSAYTLEPIDLPPGVDAEKALFAEGDSRLVHVGKRIAGGAVESVGSMIQAPAILAGQVDSSAQRARLDALDAMRRIDDALADGADPRGVYRDVYRSPLGRDVVRYGTLIQQGKADEARALRDAMQAEVADVAPDLLDPRDTSLYQAGEAVKDVSRSPDGPLYGNPWYKDSFWLDKVPTGTGSTATFLGTGLVGGALRGSAGAMTAAAGTGAAVDGADLFAEALSHGADLETAYQAFTAGAAIGLTEAAPISQMLGRADRVTGGRIRKVLLDGLKGATEEAIQETFTQVANNLVAQNLYDPERETFAHVPESAATGGTVGAIISTVVSALGGRRGRPGIRDQAAAAEEPLSADDEASPIPNDLLREGQRAMRDAAAVGRANEVLINAGLPPINTKVQVRTDGGRTAEGTVEDAFTVDDDVAPDTGIRIRLEDGSLFEEYASSIQDGTVRITPTQEGAEPPVLALPAPDPNSPVHGDGFAMDRGAPAERVADMPDSPGFRSTPIEPPTDVVDEAPTMPEVPRQQEEQPQPEPLPAAPTPREQLVEALGDRPWVTIPAALRTAIAGRFGLSAWEAGEILAGRRDRALTEDIRETLAGRPWVSLSPETQERVAARFSLKPREVSAVLQDRQLPASPDTLQYERQVAAEAERRYDAAKPRIEARLDGRPWISLPVSARERFAAEAGVPVDDVRSLLRGERRAEITGRLRQSIREEGWKPAVAEAPQRTAGVQTQRAQSAQPVAEREQVAAAIPETLPPPAGREDDETSRFPDQVEEPSPHLPETLPPLPVEVALAPERPAAGTRVRVVSVQDGSVFGETTVAGYVGGKRPRVRFAEPAGALKAPFLDLVRLEPVAEPVVAQVPPAVEAAPEKPNAANARTASMRLENVKRTSVRDVLLSAGDANNVVHDRGYVFNGVIILRDDAIKGLRATAQKLTAKRTGRVRQTPRKEQMDALLDLPDATQQVTWRGIHTDESGSTLIGQMANGEWTGIDPKVWSFLSQRGLTITATSAHGPMAIFDGDRQVGAVMPRRPPRDVDLERIGDEVAFDVDTQNSGRDAIRAERQAARETQVERLRRKAAALVEESDRIRASLPGDPAYWSQPRVKESFGRQRDKHRARMDHAVALRREAAALTERADTLATTDVKVAGDAKAARDKAIAAADFAVGDVVDSVYGPQVITKVNKKTVRLGDITVSKHLVRKVEPEEPQFARPAAPNTRRRPTPEQLIASAARGNPYFSPRFDQQTRDAVKADLRQALDRAGLTAVGARIVDRLPDGDEGMFHRGIVTISLSGTDTDGVIDHEIVHALRANGAFTAGEWKVLERHAKTWRRQFDIDGRYHDKSEEIRTEEAVAEAYRAWRNGDLEAPVSMVRTLFRRIGKIFEALGNALRGNGFATADSVFGRAVSGRLGGMQRQRETAPVVAEAMASTPDRHPARLVSIDRSSIGPYKARAAWRRAAEAAVRSLVGKKVFSGELGSDITISRRGIDHTLTGAADDLVLAATMLPDLIRTAVRSGPPEPDSRNRPDIKAIHRLSGRVKIDGRERRTQIIVRETKSGHFFYDLALMREGRSQIGAEGDARVRSQSSQGATFDSNIDPSTDPDKDGPRSARPREADGRFTSPQTRPVTDAEWSAEIERETGDRVTPEQMDNARGPFWRRHRRARGTAAQEAAIAEIFAPEEDQRTLGQRLRDTVAAIKDRRMLAFRQGVFDKFASIAEMETATFGQLQDAAASAYKAARLAQNLGSVMHVMLNHGPLTYKDGQFEVVEGFDGGLQGIFKPLIEGPAGNRLQLWSAWMVARRAQRLKAEGRENLLTDDQIKALMELGRKHPEFHQVARRWKRFNKAVLDMAEAAGVVDPEGRKLWDKNDYVPFYRVTDDAELHAPRGKQGLADQHSGIRRLTGGTAKLGNIVENMILNTTHLVDASFKNVAAQRTIDLAVETEAAQQVPMSWRTAHITPEEAARRLEEIGVQVQGMTKEQHAQHLKLFVMQPPTEPGVVSVLRDGQPKYYRVEDPLLFRAISGVNAEALPRWIKWLGMPKRLLTRGVTTFPDFMLRNFLRDSISSWVTSGQKTTPLGGLPGAVKVWREDPDVVSAMAAGGSMGGWYGHDPADVRRNLESPIRQLDGGSTITAGHRAWEWWQRVGRASEGANRMAIYQAVRANGGSEAEAAYQAMDLMDFSMKGEWAAIRFLIETVPFLNARIQGMYKLGRAARDNPRSFMLRGAMVSAAALALAAANLGNEEYDELPDWEKDFYFHFFIGDAHVRLPKPFEVGVIFGTLPERALRKAAGQDRWDQTGESVRRAVLDTFSFNPIPQALKPLIEQWANRDSFRGSPIVSQALTRLEPAQQYTTRTSAGARWIGQAFDLSPVRIDHLTRAYLGTVADVISASTNAMDRAVFSEGEAPDRRISDLPVIGWAIRDGERSSRYVQEFYDLRDEIDAFASTIRVVAEQGRMEDAQARIAENPDWKSRAKFVRRIAKDLSEINAMKKKIYWDRSMSGAEKRRRLDELQRMQNEVARTAYERLRP